MLHCSWRHVKSIILSIHWRCNCKHLLLSKPDESVAGLLRILSKKLLALYQAWFDVRRCQLTSADILAEGHHVYSTHCSMTYSSFSFDLHGESVEHSPVLLAQYKIVFSNNVLWYAYRTCSSVPWLRSTPRSSTSRPFFCSKSSAELFD